MPIFAAESPVAGFMSTLRQLLWALKSDSCWYNQPLKEKKTQGVVTLGLVWFYPISDGQLKTIESTKKSCGESDCWANQ